MIYGIIDLGSNTIRLSIYKCEGGGAKQLLNKKTMAGLSGYISDGRLSEKGIAKACEVLKSYMRILSNFGIESCSVFATASLRNITNTGEAVEQIEKCTGIRPDLLSGEEEARLGFVGVMRDREACDGLLVDVGGGSTEISAISGKAVVKAVSMPVGSLNLYLKHVSSFQPKKKEIREIKKDIKNELEKNGIRDMGVQNVIFAIGGTARAALKLYNDFYGFPRSSATMEMVRFSELLQLYKSDKKVFTSRVLQIAPERVHTIIPGMLILAAAAKSSGAEIIEVCGSGVREGYLFDRVLGADSGICAK